MTGDNGWLPDWAVPALISLLAFMLAILLHEIAHGLAALALGDTTAKRLGRLSLNPVRHVDPFGTILVPAMLVVGQLAARGTVGFAFGWAKPVPVDVMALRNPRRGMMLVAAAGPAMNFLLAWLAGLLGHFAEAVGPMLSVEAREIVYQFIRVFIVANLVLGLFNLLPIPPLDGGRIVAGLLPRALALPYMRLERWGLLTVLFLLFGLPYLLDGFDPVRSVLDLAADSAFELVLLLSGHRATP